MDGILKTNQLNTSRASQILLKFLEELKSQGGLIF